MEVFFFYERRQLAQVTEGQHHSHGSEQYRQLKGDGDPCRQREKRLTAKVQRPVVSERPADKAKCSTGTHQAVNKTCSVQACIAKAHCGIQSMDWHWCIHFMDLVT